MARPQPVPPSAPRARRLGFWEKAVYGFGDLIIAVRMTAFQFHLMPLYTDVVMLPPLLAGTAKMLGFVWDGVNDPVTGWLSDRTQTRFGRRRPFLLAAALPMGFTFALLWSPPSGLGPLAGFLYMLLAFVVLDTFFTLYATPYLALGAELSSDYHERTQLSASRSFFHVVGLFAGGVVPGVLVRRAATPAAGYATAGVLMGSAMVVIALVTGAFTRESPVAPARAGGGASWQTFRAGMTSTLANRPFRIMIATFGLILLAGGINQIIVPYAFQYWLGMGGMVNTVIGVYLATSVLSLPLWTLLAGRLGKDRALRCCILYASVTLAALPLVFAPGMSMTRLTAFLVVAGAGNGGWAVLPVAITADIIDTDELATHQRREGAFFGVWTLVMKLATALASGLVGLALQLSGYVANAVQSPSAILGIRALYGPVPSLVMLGAFVVFWRFPLTRERHREVQAALAARRGA